MVKRREKKKTNKLIDNGIMEPKMGCGYVLNGIRNVKITYVDNSKCLALDRVGVRLIDGQGI